jgi:hypothetical protein
MKRVENKDTQARKKRPTMFRSSAIFLTSTLVMAAFTALFFGLAFYGGRSEFPGLGWWLFALFALTAVLVTIRESTKAIVAAIHASPAVTAPPMPQAVRPAVPKTEQPVLAEKSRAMREPVKSSSETAVPRQPEYSRLPNGSSKSYDLSPP